MKYPRSKRRLFLVYSKTHIVGTGSGPPEHHGRNRTFPPRLTRNVGGAPRLLRVVQGLFCVGSSAKPLPLQPPAPMNSPTCGTRGKMAELQTLRRTPSCRTTYLSARSCFLARGTCMDMGRGISFADDRRSNLQLDKVARLTAKDRPIGYHGPLTNVNAAEWRPLKLVKHHHTCF